MFIKTESNSSAGAMALLALTAVVLTGCGGSAAQVGEPSPVPTVTATVTAPAEPTEENPIKSEPGSGAYPDDFFVAGVERYVDDLLTDYFDDEAAVVEFGLSICHAFERGGTIEQVRKAIENDDARVEGDMQILSMDATFNYCPQYRDEWLDDGSEWTVYK